MARIILLMLLAVLFACVGGPAYADPITAGVVIGTLAGAGAAASATVIFGLSVATSAIIIGATSGVLAYYSTKKNADAAYKRQAEAARDVGGRQQTFVSPIVSHKLIYGQAKVSGPIIYAASSGRNRDLNLVIAIAGHEIESYDAFYIGDEYVPMEDVIDRSVPGGANREIVLTAVEGRFRSKIYITPFYGRPDQTASTEIARQVGSTEWTSAHRLRGIAYLYVRLIRDDSVFPNGVPQIRAVVKGKKLYDPRTPALPARWSNNPALVLRDYLLESYGLEASATEIDEISFIKAAMEADTFFAHMAMTSDTDTISIDGGEVTSTAVAFNTGDRVTLGRRIPGGANRAPDTGYAISFGNGRFLIASTLARARAGDSDVSSTITGDTMGTEVYSLTRTGHLKFTIDGVFDTASTPKTIISTMLLAQSAQMTYQNGRFRIISTAEGRRPTNITNSLIGEGDLLKGVSIVPEASGRDRYNSVKGIYVDPQTDWQPTDYPARSIQALQRGNDGLRESELPLEYTINPIMAEWLAEAFLRDGQQSMTANILMGLDGLRHEIGDHVFLTHSAYGFNQRHFRVVNTGLLPQRAGDGGGLVVQLTLREWNDGVYNITPAQLSRGATDMPTAPIPPTLTSTYYSPAPSALTLASGNDHLTVGTAGNIDVNILATWVAPEGAEFVDHYEFRYKKADNTEYGAISQVPGGAIRNLFGPLEDGVRYDVQIRSVNALGVKSVWISANHMVVGKTQPPPDVIRLSGRTLHEGTREFNVDTSNWPADVRVGGGVEIRIRIFVAINAGNQPAWETMDPISENPINTFPFTTTLISAGQYWLAARMVDSSGNYSTNTVYRQILLGNQAQGTAVLDRDEAIPAIDWNGTLGAGTVKVRSGGANVLVADKPTGGDDFTDLPNFLGSFNTVINDIVFHNAPVIYTSRIVDLNNTLVFTPFVNVEYRGDLHSIQIIHGQRATQAGIGGATTTTLENDELGEPITDRYVQFRVEVRANAATQTNAMLTGMEVRLSGDTVEHRYTNLNTATTSPPPGFIREVINGNIRLEFAHTGQVANIETVELTGFQRPPGSTGTWGVIPVIISKGVLHRGGLPIAQIELRRVDFENATLNGDTTDGVIDIRLTGPRAAVNN